MTKRSEYEGLESSIRSALMGKSTSISPDPLQVRDAFKVSCSKDKPPLNPRWRNPFYSRPIVVALLSTFAILGMAGGAVAADNFPGPTRAIAYELHLPVSSPALVAAKNAESQLRASLERGDRSEVKTGILELRIRLHALDSADLHSIYQDASSLLRAAQEYLDRSKPTPTTETTQSSKQLDNLRLLG